MQVHADNWKSKDGLLIWQWIVKLNCCKMMMMCESVLLLPFPPEFNIFSCREAADSRTLPPGGWGQSLVGADHQEGICNILKNYFINNQKGNCNIIQYYFFNHQESIFQKYFFITTKIVFQIVSKRISSTPLQYLSAQVYWPPAASGHTARLDSAASSHTDRGGNRLHGHQHLYRHDHH